MYEEVLKLLSEIEDKYQVKIIFACEAGSRAYEMAISESDFDIRFIYLSPLPTYLSLTKEENTITIHRDNYDIQGWDLKKALFLAGKSNPSLLEWMHSPIIYKKDPSFFEELRRISKEEFSRKGVITHYLKMAKRNRLAFAESEKPSFLLHSIRAMLMAEQLLKGKSIIIEFSALIKNSSCFYEEDMNYLLSLKEESMRMDKDHNNSLILRICHLFEKAEKECSELPDENPNICYFQNLFLRILGVKE